MSKKIIFTLCFALATAFALHAQNADDVRYDNVQIVRQGDDVEVSFKAFIGSRCIGRKGQFLFTPMLCNDTCEVALPSIAVSSRHTDWMEYRETLSGKHPTAAAYRSNNNGRVSYRATIPWQPGLTNVALRMERTLQSSRKRHYPFPAVRITRKLYLTAAPVEVPQVVSAGAVSATGAATATSSLADSLVRQYSFLFPLSRPDASDAGDPFAAANERGALRINFSRSTSTLERYYRENDTALRTLASALHRMEAAGTARLARIVITGFSGIDGALNWNNRLAWERADAVRTFIVENTGVNFSQIHLRNGSEDWSTLRHLVEQCAEMESRYDVLRIIDTVPILSGREKRLMDLSGGMPYRYMKRYLFPKLRNAALIKVYYAE